MRLTVLRYSHRDKELFIFVTHITFTLVLIKRSRCVRTASSFKERWFEIRKSRFILVDQRRSTYSPASTLFTYKELMTPVIGGDRGWNGSWCLVNSI